MGFFAVWLVDLDCVGLDLKVGLLTYYGGLTIYFLIDECDC